MSKRMCIICHKNPAKLVEAIKAFIAADEALTEWDANDYSPDPIGDLVAEKARRFAELNAALSAVEEG